MRRAIVLIVLAMYGIMTVFSNSYKLKVATGEMRTRRDGTEFHVWDRTELSEASFNKLRDTDFKDAKVTKRGNATIYSIEKDGLPMVLTVIEDEYGVYRE